MNEFHPLVSIVIPVYNGANYMREAIDSALAQTYDNCEVLVINDGSNDNGETDRIARSYGDKIRYFAKANGGVATALNLGIKEMRGEYFSWLSHDDVYLPEKVEVQVNALACCADKVTLVYSNHRYIDEHGNVIGEAQLHDARDSGGLFCFLYEESSVHGCSLLIPKQAFETVGLFSESLPTTQDYDLWLRFARSYPYVYENQVLVCSRTHAGQGSLTIGNHFQEIRELFKSYFPEYVEHKLYHIMKMVQNASKESVALGLMKLRAKSMHYIPMVDDIAESVCRSSDDAFGVKSKAKIYAYALFYKCLHFYERLKRKLGL